MIPTYIETERDVPVNELVIVLDAGGTNFRAATCYFDENKNPVFENFKLYPMPGVKEKVSRRKFFEIMTGYVKDIAGVSSKVGFCFSYPCDMFPNKDGKLIRFSKEIKADEVIGEMIGANLTSAMASSGLGGDKNVVILNDTVATLLAGRAGSGKRDFDSYVGFILGTGTNTSYVESNKNITKKKDLDLTKSQIINVESGGFGKGPRGEIDLLLDGSTNNPGEYTFEKMISGAYLGALCLEVIRVACKDALFSNNAKEALIKLDRLDTKEVSDFLSFPEDGNSHLGSALLNAKDEDRDSLAYLLRKIVERAAKLSAINLSSTVLKSEKGKDPNHPVCIVAEGTTFYGLKGLKPKVEYYLKKYLEGKKQRYCEIVKVENATLIGAAIAGLTN